MALLPQWMKSLTPEMIEKAEIELGETPANKKRCLEEFRDLIQEDIGFGPCMEDAFLLRFLRAKKFNVKKTFKTFKNYYDFRHRYSGVITDLKPSQLKTVIDTDCTFITPKRLPNGTGVMIIFVGSFDWDRFTPYDLFAAGFLTGDIGIETEASQVCGCALILDFQGITLGKMRHFSTFSFLSLVVRGLQNCWPFRMNAFHMVNEPSYFSMTYSMVKPMLSKKLKDRVHFHGDNLASLHEHVPLECLPKRLGGYLGEKEFEEYRRIIYSKESKYEKLNKYIYNGQISCNGGSDIAKETTRLLQEN